MDDLKEFLEDRFPLIVMIAILIIFALFLLYLIDNKSKREQFVIEEKIQGKNFYFKSKKKMIRVPEIEYLTKSVGDTILIPKIHIYHTK